jgi:plastocyanin
MRLNLNNYGAERQSMGKGWRALILAGLACVVLAGLVALRPGAARADEAAFTLTIREHRFEPARLEVPAGKTIKLVIHNADPTPEEFESRELNREKVIAGGATVTVYLSALDAGSYAFIGEFHEDTAKGQIVAK